MSSQLTKGDIVYYARIMPNLGIFDVYDIKIRTITDTWFSGVEKRDKKVFLFPFSAINEYVFLNRKDAVDVATNAEELSTSQSIESMTYGEISKKYGAEPIFGIVRKDDLRDEYRNN